MVVLLKMTPMFCLRIQRSERYIEVLTKPNPEKLKTPNYLLKRRFMLLNLAKSLNNNLSSQEEEFGER